MRKTNPEDQCSHLSRYFQSYLDQELNSKEISLVETHINQCSPCEENFRGLQQLNSQIKERLRQFMPLPEDFAPKICRGIPKKGTGEDSSQAFQIGGYKIVEKVGQGSMGTVFKAIQLSLRRVVALKILSSKYINNKNYIDRFQREARAAASLQHPNIIQVYDVGQEKDIYYFSMEFVEGDTVGALLEKEGKMEIPRALDIIVQIARALAHAESLKIVHRDIKPDNIIIDRYGVARLADLGMAKKIIEIEKELSDSEDLFITQIGTIMGTPEYMSPEQATSSKTVNHQTDIYSLGATFYHMVTGLPPFRGETVMEVLGSVLHDRIRFDGAAEKEVPLPIRRIVQKMTAKNLKERYKNGEELLRALLEVRRRTTSGFLQVDSTFLPALRGDTTSLQVSQNSTILGKHKKKRRSFLNSYVLYGALGLLLLALVYFFFSGDGGKSDYRSALQYATSHPRETEKILENFQKISHQYPQTKWGAMAREEFFRRHRDRDFELFLSFLRKASQRKLFSLYQECEKEKKISRENKERMEQIQKMVRQEMNRLFYDKLQELSGSTSFDEGRRILMEIKKFGSPEQILHAEKTLQKKQASFKD